MKAAEFTRDQSILVIGASGLDVIGQMGGEIQAGTSNPAQIRTSYGGVARNVAENLARLSQNVNLVSMVGNDQFGNDILNYTKSTGVDISATIITNTFPTGFYMAILDSFGRVQFAVDDMRLISELTPSYLSSVIEDNENIGMIFLDANLSEESIKAILKHAKKNDLPVCADPVTSSLAGKLKKHLPDLHLVTPNAAEAGILTGKPFNPTDRGAGVDAARMLVNTGVDIAIVTLAEFGVCYATSETNGHIPAIRTAITDPTGAGDAMTAAIIFGLNNALSVDDAVRLGVSAASLTLRTPGTVCPDLTVEKLYSQLIT